MGDYEQISGGSNDNLVDEVDVVVCRRTSYGSSSDSSDTLLDTNGISSRMALLQPRKDRTFKVTIWFALSVASMCLGSSFQFGYNVGVVNIPQEIVKAWINKSYGHSTDGGAGLPSDTLNLIWSVVTSIFAVGGMIGGTLAAPIADKVGRKKVLLINSVFSFAAALLMGLSKAAGQFYMLIAGRLLIGFNSGIHTAIAPLYLTEISPLLLRGALGTCHQLFTTVGIMTSEIIGLGPVLGTEKWWPIVFAFTAVATVIQLITLPFCPESPKYLLIVRGDEVAARQSLHRLRGAAGVDEAVEEMYSEMRAIRRLPDVRFRQFFTERYLLWPLVMAAVMMMSQQLCGIVAALFYSTSIFESAGLGEAESGYATVGMGALFVIFSMGTVPLVERAGRRRLMLLALGAMWILSLLLLGALHLKNQGYDWAAYLAIVFVVFFVISFAFGPGPIPWFFVYELFLQNSRSIAGAIAVTINWFSLFVAGLMFLPLEDSVHEFSFLVFTGLLSFFWLFTFLFIPETKNRPIEDIVESFKRKAGRSPSSELVTRM